MKDCGPDTSNRTLKEVNRNKPGRVRRPGPGGGLGPFHRATWLGALAVRGHMNGGELSHNNAVVVGRS